MFLVIVQSQIVFHSAPVPCLTSSARHKLPSQHNWSQLARTGLPWRYLLPTELAGCEHTAAFTTSCSCCFAVCGLAGMLIPALRRGKQPQHFCMQLSSAQLQCCYLASHIQKHTVLSARELILLRRENKVAPLKLLMQV